MPTPNDATFDSLMAPNIMEIVNREARRQSTKWQSDRHEFHLEDMEQELYLRVGMRLHEFDRTRGTFEQWVTVRARHAAVDYVRSIAGRRNSGKLLRQNEDNEGHDRQAPRETRVETRDHLDHVYRLVTAFWPDYLQVMRHHALDTPWADMNHGEKLQRVHFRSLINSASDLFDNAA